MTLINIVRVICLINWSHREVCLLKGSIVWQARGYLCVHNKVFLWFLSTTNMSLNKQQLTWSMGLPTGPMLSCFLFSLYTLVGVCTLWSKANEHQFSWKVSNLSYGLFKVMLTIWVHTFSPLQTVELLVLFIGLENFLGSGNTKFFLHNPFILFMMNLQQICAFGRWICGEFVCAKASAVTVSCLGYFPANLQWIWAFGWWICCKFMHLGSLY